MTEYTAAAAPARPSWREENRQDRIARARLEMEREAARARARTAERDAAEDRRAARDERRQRARADARRERDARLAALAAWITAHVTDLLFVPVITVPGLLAWTAMAAYGASLYPGLGVILPSFSEGAMWVFEAAATLTRRKDDRRRQEDPSAAPSPVWHLRLGVAVFAGFGAVLNFAHGLSPATPHHGPVTGAVMALISVAGVTAHHLTKAGPRRTRAERDDARIERSIRRREIKARKVAVKNAVAELGADGTVRLNYWPAPEGTDAVPGTQPDITPDAAPPVPGAQPDPVPPADPAPAPEVHPEPVPRVQPRRTRTRTRTAPRNRPGVTAESAEARFAADLAAGHLPSIRQIKQELHVGQDSARVIRGHLETAAAGTDADDSSDAPETA